MNKPWRFVFHQASLITAIIFIVLSFHSLTSAATTLNNTDKSCNCQCDELVALGRDAITSENILKWSKLATITTFSYGFGNYQTALEKASLYFTPKGWAEYKQALDKSGNLDAVKSQKLVVSSELMEPPKIIKSFKNRYGQDAWEIQIPVQVSYQNANNTLKQNLLVTLQVDKTHNAKTMKGLGISQFIAEPTSLRA